MGKRLRKLTTVSALLILPIAFVNCGEPAFNVEHPYSTPLPSKFLATEVEQDPSAHGPDFDWVSMKAAGTDDPDCMANAAFDACIYYKNPFVHSYALRDAPLTTLLMQGRNMTSVQTYGVTLSDQLSANKLQSNSVKIIRGDFSDLAFNPSTKLPDTITSFKVPYASDTNLVGAMTHIYFWAQKMQSELTSRAGVYYGANKALPIAQQIPSVANPPAELENNAFFANDPITNPFVAVGTSVVNQTGNSFEGGLNSEVVLHEIGHANSAFAQASGEIQDNYSFETCPYKINSSCDYGWINCGSATNSSVNPVLGCRSGIEEGLADFFYLMMFPNFPSIMETNNNDLSGRSERDMRLQMGRSVASFISQQYCDVGTGAVGSGVCMNQLGQYGKKKLFAEVHTVGAAYTSILYSIYSNPEVDKRIFEKTFMLHLALLTSSSRFPEARDILISIDENTFGGINASQIRAAFSQKGVQ